MEKIYHGKYYVEIPDYREFLDEQETKEVLEEVNEAVRKFYDGFKSLEGNPIEIYVCYSGDSSVGMDSFSYTITVPKDGEEIREKIKKLYDIIEIEWIISYMISSEEIANAKD
jgi:uncharacterized protein YneR